MNEKRRVHIHIAVEDLEKSIVFYKTQLQSEPTKVKEDYAQWIIDDLSLNLAISTRGYDKGVNHLGIQYESDEALEKTQTLFDKANIEGKEDKEAACCYKASNKYWVKDPAGVIWENYHSMKDIEVFGVDGKDRADGCCAPTSGNFCGTPFPSDSSGCCS